MAQSISVSPTDRWLLVHSSEKFPDQPLDYATHKLIVEDTGDIHMWTGTRWIQTHAAGIPLNHHKYNNEIIQILQEISSNIDALLDYKTVEFNTDLRNN